MRVLWRSVWVVLVWVLVAVLVWVSQLLVLGVGSGVVGRWLLLGVGARQSWLRAWWVVLVDLPLCPSGVSGGPAAPLVEGCWVLVLCIFPCCVCLWCSCWWWLWRCVLCARAGVCAVCWWCFPVPVLASLGLAWWLCVSAGAVFRGPSPALAVGPAAPGLGLLVVVCSPPAPFACPPSSFSLPRRLGRCSPGALPGRCRAVVGVREGWVGGGGGVLDAGSGPFPWCFLLGGPMLALPVRV